MDESLSKMTAHTSILFVSQPEAGQANVVFSVIRHFLLLSQKYGHNVRVHLAADPDKGKFKRRVEKTFTTSEVTFHPLSDRGVREASEQSIELLRHPPAAKDSKPYVEMTKMLTWDPYVYAKNVKEVMEIVDRLQPALVVCDQLAMYGVDALQTLKKRFVVLSPTLLGDVYLIPHQPWMQWLWHYPIAFTGLPYPVPLLSIPTNILSFIRLAYATTTSPEIKELRLVRKSQGITGPLPFVDGYPTQAELFLSAGFREADFPLSALPQNAVECGPILFDDASSERAMEEKAELEVWMDEAKAEKQDIVLISLGNHVVFSKESKDTDAIAKAIRTVISALNVRVIWKLPNAEDNADMLRSVLGNECLLALKGASVLNGMAKAKKVWITDWIVQPLHKLYKHDTVKVFVHHGGGNSYLESAKYGLKQFVLSFAFASEVG
ncbi:glycosyltransferase family 1 protein [Atractiella rhizophila]|nr:glycosyltransferase family 1 protein [Atractiella rhizophila]